MPDSKNSIVIEVKGHPLQVTVVPDERLCLDLRIAECSLERNDISLPLFAPFRREMEPARLFKIVQKLLAHDFILARRLAKGKVLTFKIEKRDSKYLADFNSITSLDQNAAWNATASAKVLPWFLPRADTDLLYPYQKIGVDWLLSEPNRLLADDMGLGKTVQTIFAVRHGFSEHLFDTVLILCPKSLVVNWLKEFQKWAPELLSVGLSAPSRSAEKVWEKAARNTHVMIANYEQVREANKIASDIGFDLVVADEAHRLRNAGSQISKGFKQLERDRFWALTGTPIERDLKDLATLMSLLDRKRFSIADADNPGPALRQRVKPYLLRRTKTAVLKELPEVVSRREEIELFHEQKTTYLKVQQGITCSGERIQNGLQKLGELRRVCDYDPISKTSSKLERIREDLVKVKNAGEKAIVFSFVLEPLKALADMAENSLRGLFISGEMTGEERNRVIERFKTDPEITVLFASSKVASEGLTLVEANHVFFINRWWNPSSNAQARDRVNRIGQKRTVFIHEYVCVGTVEEKIQKLLNEKGELYGSVVGKLEDLLITDPDISAHLNIKE